MRQILPEKRKWSEDAHDADEKPEEEVQVSEVESSAEQLNSEHEESGSSDGDHTSDDDDDEENEWDPEFNRHNAENEALPPCGAYHPSFERGVEIYKRLFDEFPIEEVLLLKQERLGLLCSEVEKLRPIPEPEPLRIALLGEAGRGKTSLLNSLVDRMDLARTGASGKSETTVVTEYRRSFDQQSLQYAAKITFLNKSTIRALLQDHVHDYQAWHFYRDKSWDVDTVKEVKNKARTTLEVLREMLHNKSDFVSAESTHAWLKEHSDPKEAASILANSCEALITDHPLTAADELFRYIEATTPSQLRKALSPYTTSRSVHRNLTSPPALWPLVDTVSVGIKGVRLLEHLIFADLPGIQDKNRVRVATTQAHLQKCDVVWIVANIDRVASSSTLAEMLDRTFDRFAYTSSDRIAVICTHSDDKTDGTLKDLKRRKFNVESADALTKVALTLEREVKKQKVKLAKAKTSAEKVKLREDIEENELQIASVKSQRFNILVTMRNNDIRTELQEEYADKVPDHRALNVFCVSNTEYSKFKKEEEPLAPNLTVEHTGIPELRGFALSLVAPRREEAFRRCVRNNAPLMLAMVTMWCTKTSVQRPEELLAMVAKPRELVGETVKKYYSQTVNTLESGLKVVLSNNLPLLISEAQKQHRVYKGWHFATYQSWVRNYGVHETPRQPRCSWHAEFLKPLRSVLRADWAAFIEAQESSVSSCLEESKRLLRSTFESIQDEPEVRLSPSIKAYEVYLTTLAGSLDNYFHDEAEKVARKFNDLKLAAVTDCSGSYFVASMQSTFKKAIEVQILRRKLRQKGGMGISAQFQLLIDNKISNEGPNNPFAATQREFLKGMEDGIRSSMSATEERVLAIFDSAIKQFEVVMSNDEDYREVDTAGIRRVRAKLTAFASRGRELVDTIEHQLECAKNAHATIQVDVD